MARSPASASRRPRGGEEPDPGRPGRRSLGRAERDIVALGIIIAAIIMFVGTGSSVLTRMARSFLAGHAYNDAVLGNAVILNIALLIFGWRRYVELNHEIAERRQAEATAYQLAHTDALTGCLNRRSLDGALERFIADTGNEGRDVAVMMIDLDRFKRSNDMHGHQAGDAVLTAAVQRIKAELPDRSIVARLGGDEFVCATTFDPAHPGTVEHIAARINEAIAQPIRFADIAIDISASIGLARARLTGKAQAPADLARQLLFRADLAMYQAKKGGRNRFCWFEQDMESELRFRSELERGIREGIARGEFVPFYEKQVDLDTGEISGFEMLARWQSPQYGLVQPDLFIPVAEEIGVIAELSEALIRQALRDALEWDQRLTLSVNISPIQLRDPWFAQRLLKLLIAARFPPQRLDIEVTESCLHENLTLVRTLMTSLKNQGIQVSLDDFGTGYSSLAQLRSLPFDRIKIDRSFVSSLCQSKDSVTIVKAISSLGKGMNLPITAEGIENADVLDELRKFGSFHGQGFLYGRPVDAATVRSALAEKGMLVALQPPVEPSPDIATPLRAKR